MTKKCGMCSSRFDVLDAHYCMYKSCDLIMCKKCAYNHEHVFSVEEDEQSSVDHDLDQFHACDCKQYTNLGYCGHVGATSGW